MKRSRTFDALIARGIDSQTADRLVSDSHTLGGLKQLNTDELAALGLNQVAIGAIHDGARPPIPTATVDKLLHDSRTTCCICETAHRPIVLHHIDPWSGSHSHDESNLVVLCLLCHDEAHTKRELSLNLTPNRIRSRKAMWLQTVEKQVVAELLQPDTAKLNRPMWDYFNHRRIVDVAGLLKIDPTECENYSSLANEKCIAETGEPIWNSTRGDRDNSLYLYDGLGWHDRRLYAFYADLTKRVLDATRIINLSSCWNHKTFTALASPGTVIAFSGNWRFKRAEYASERGPGQRRNAYVQKRKLRIEFGFDCWETTSSSASSNLSGNWLCTGIAIVRHVENVDGVTVHACSGLAIGTGFKIPRPWISVVEDDTTVDTASPI
ncbi:HNH endonuclease [Rosistilla oblonga]|uniref:HNH endonuclease n=1 Tax=Rosistilla oblonga TaxID=2527990 RepID=UPI003A97D627